MEFSNFWRFFQKNWRYLAKSSTFGCLNSDKFFCKIFNSTSQIQPSRLDFGGSRIFEFRHKRKWWEKMALGWTTSSTRVGTFSTLRPYLGSKPKRRPDKFPRTDRRLKSCFSFLAGRWTVGASCRSTHQP